MGAFLRLFIVIDTHTHTLSRTPLDESYACTTQTFTSDKHPCPGKNSNPQSQKGSCCRAAP